MKEQKVPMTKLFPNNIILSLGLNGAREVYKSLFKLKNLSEDKVKCDVCLVKWYTDDDKIIICDGCNEAVHQSCYGREIKDKVPKENVDWLCVRCKTQETHPVHIKCAFCNDRDGIMTFTEKFGFHHINCLQWLSGVWWKSDDKFEAQESGKGIWQA